MFSAIPVLAFPWIRTVAQLVHARAVVAHVTVDLDLDVGIEPTRDGMRAARVDDAPAPRPRPTVREVVQALIQLAQRSRLEIDHLHRRVLSLGDGHHTSAFSQA